MDRKAAKEVRDASKQAGFKELFRSSLEQIIDTGHALVKLSDRIEWSFFDERFSASYAETGRPGGGVHRQGESPQAL
ncbi:MAG: hypothetical protein P8Y58_04995 [Novosphingobium sp.]